jgi:hypothetical protein
MDTQPYRQILEPQPLDFTEWETPRLRDYLADLHVRAEFANQRQYPEVEREINVATVELCRRRADSERLQARLAQHVGQTAVEGV